MPILVTAILVTLLVLTGSLTLNTDLPHPIKPVNSHLLPGDFASLSQPKDSSSRTSLSLLARQRIATLEYAEENGATPEQRDMIAAEFDKKWHYRLHHIKNH
jgi:hypothetical protein